MATLAGRWWNGRYGIARRDIWLYNDTSTWHAPACRVEARQGRPETALTWSHTYPDEVSAGATVEQMIERTEADGWRDTTRVVLQQPNASGRATDDRTEKDN